MPNVNLSRLKDKLLAEIPELEAHRKGRDVMLAFKQDVGEALSQAIDYSDARIVTKAAKLLRKQMISTKELSMVPFTRIALKIPCHQFFYSLSA
ncbi:hypothetical protein DPMN_130411 [Dreissena polymorpha]|uniref:Uncharacterized protein n=1 Tax=Dreissena polymorpha TaxID=45954 RepID=A0A9D4H7Q5_DREPO|nr:hypothetical protein DPMN_130411 [Dreissena polymorpha]